MSWAARRRLIILILVGVVAVAFLSVVVIATFTKTPTCTDGVQNQGESGIDCGGPCPYLCTADELPPTVLFTKAISNGVGRTDVVALVENKNAAAAAKNVPYRAQLYSSDRTIIQEVSGTLDLPPGATEAVFIPGMASGKQTVANAFLIIDPAAPEWYGVTGDPRVLPLVSNVKQIGTLDAPRVEATLSNRSATALTNVQAVILVRDEQGGVIAASSTIVPAIPAQGVATATFTWNSAFTGVPASLEVLPVIPLP